VVARLTIRGAAAILVAAALAGCHTKPAQSPRCVALQQRYGLTPCPADPIPVESVTVQNLDRNLPDAEAHRIAMAYLRSRALYYLAIQANSDRFFTAGVISRPDDTPLMFDAETSHIKDARDRHGTLVLVSRSTLKSIRVVPLPEDLRAGLGTPTAPMADAVVIDADGPEQQVIRVPGRPDEPVSTLERGDSYRLLVGGVLVTKEGLPETFAELGQWECLDPDTHGACQLPSAGQ